MIADAADPRGDLGVFLVGLHEDGDVMAIKGFAGVRHRANLERLGRSVGKVDFLCLENVAILEDQGVLARLARVLDVERRVALGIKKCDPQRADRMVVKRLEDRWDDPRDRLLVSPIGATISRSKLAWYEQNRGLASPEDQQDGRGQARCPKPPSVQHGTHP